MSQLSREDILAEKEKNGLIILPFDLNRLKGASYDVSPTIIAMSTKTGMLETVYREKEYPNKYYIYVKAKDTVLAVSREYISVPLRIAGYVVSRVSKVSEGFGHVSTSIDPNWKGALLIALSNPSNKPIKVYVGGANDEIENSNSLATISFHYLNTPCSDIGNIHTGMRLDLLKKLSYSTRQGVKAGLTRLFHPKRKKYTDFFFHFCENSILDMEHWPEIVKELQGFTPKAECAYCKHFVESAKRKKQCLSDFIITEHFLLRIIHWLQKYWATIWKTIAIIFAFLVAVGLLPESWQSAIKSFFESVHLF